MYPGIKYLQFLKKALSRVCVCVCLEDREIRNYPLDNIKTLLKMKTKDKIFFYFPPQLPYPLGFQWPEEFKE